MISYSEALEAIRGLPEAEYQFHITRYHHDWLGDSPTQSAGYVCDLWEEWRHIRVLCTGLINDDGDAIFLKKDGSTIARPASMAYRAKPEINALENMYKA